MDKVTGKNMSITVDGKNIDVDHLSFDISIGPPSAEIKYDSLEVISGEIHIDKIELNPAFDTNAAKDRLSAIISKYQIDMLILLSTKRHRKHISKKKKYSRSQILVVMHKIGPPTYPMEYKINCLLDVSDKYMQKAAIEKSVACKRYREWLTKKMMQ